MPLFGRSDGDVIRGLSPERRIMPYLMRGRNESCVYHEQNHDIGKARRWLRDYNRASPPQAATMFHLFMWVVGQGLHLFPHLNRFVSGGRLYQRRGSHVSFAAKKQFALSAPLITVKKSFARGEPFAQGVQSMTALIGEGRSDVERSVDKELRLVLLLPGLLLRLVMWIARWADRFNLMPRKMIENDPMYASVFVANLGSVGLDSTYHHLYEYGTISLFAVLGMQKKMMVMGRDGKPERREVMQVRWTLDERVIDGFYAAEALRYVQRVMEDPERYLGKAEAVAAGESVELGKLHSEAA
jgi:hypothetical protein